MIQSWLFLQNLGYLGKLTLRMHYDVKLINHIAKHPDFLIDSSND